MDIIFKISPYLTYTYDGIFDKIYERYSPYLKVNGTFGRIKYMNPPVEPYGMDMTIEPQVSDVTVAFNRIKYAIDKSNTNFIALDNYIQVEAKIVLDDMDIESKLKQSRDGAEFVCKNTDFVPVVMYTNAIENMVFRLKFNVCFEEFCNLVNGYVVRF